METLIAKQILNFEGHHYNCQQILNTHPESLSEKEFVALFYFLHEWFNDSPTLTIHTSGSTGTPKEIEVEKELMINSAVATCLFLELKPGDTALLCMPLDYIAGKMMVVRALVANLSLIITETSGHPLQNIYFPCTFAAMVPLQIYNTLRDKGERWLLGQIKHIIIGGGAINKEIETELKEMSGHFWSSYGMTETLSHIALRRLNGLYASAYYTPFEDVSLSLSTDNTLIINAPRVCRKPLTTNDIATIKPDGTFRIIGRSDNVINSGGIKIQIEEIEEKLRPVLRQSYAITSRPNQKFGQEIVLLLQKSDKSPTPKEIEKKLEEILPAYWRPKQIIYVEEIPHTDNGKINRNNAKKLANKE